ncbi:MAG: rane dipeptidase [Moorella sp. (in: firmicutes)]|jgi:putative glutamine amidotransferase|uniref:gamma-glutamyl-gamma-aminobutyrate hydrolase family protein n=1 Tax=unclassified Neomoorella TaxID=2676739 RepID=UPI0010FFB8DF|nr:MULTISPECIES: gamma-glutamyl-gamma-aminobutyrate hydrolase family protein [unclassified Moorella (in: firmicutes)]MDK2816751.1 rane dipeptidase [Moorella sp. (in: firmicutes)]MDK2894767.1 rane dipeptidase [Moorella sp. (in: firmicutes)]GEA15642.1 anthranilate synthase component II [Moorella sp. E308F]GEA19500.1 anthranilate synthase component II [Moorella sp. E306M]
MRSTRVGITTGWEQGNVVPGWSLIYTVKACVEAVEKAGGIPLLLPVVKDPEIRRETLNNIDALIAAGEVLSVKRNVLNGDQAKDLESQNPLRFANERDYLLGALERNMPILGICRGHQVLNVVCGGTMYLDDIHMRPENSGVVHQQGSRPPAETIHKVEMDGILARLTGKREAMVNSFHRQAVMEPPPRFAVVARAPDGIVEAMASLEHDFVLGVQFHPEVLQESFWLELFRELVNAGAR